jgi:hypothetical protein
MEVADLPLIISLDCFILLRTTIFSLQNPNLYNNLGIDVKILHSFCTFNCSHPWKKSIKSKNIGLN